MTWTTKYPIVLVCALLISVGIASIGFGAVEPTRDLPQSATKKLASVEGVTANGEGMATELVLKLTTPVTYTSYKTTSPLRLVIDLSQATQGKVTTPISINKGNFKSVSVTRYDTDAGVLTRIDVELVKDADAVLSVSKEKPGEIRVSFPALAVASAAPQAKVAETPQTAVNGGVANLASAQVGVSSDGTPAIPSQSGAEKKLTSVTTKDGSIVLVIDGGAGEFKTLRLTKPERFVVDLMGVKCTLQSRIVPINALGVSSARLGIYSDKVRVVFDTIDTNFPDATVNTSSEGVVIALKRAFNDKSASPVQQSAEIQPTSDFAKPEPIPESAKPNPSGDTKPAFAATGADSSSAIVNKAVLPETAGSKPAQKELPQKNLERSIPKVEMIDFQVIEGISRVAVKVTGDFAAEQPQNSPGFVTLTIKHAVLPKKLQRSLETHNFISPVLRVTPLLIKHRKGTDTKIRVAMRKSVPYEFRQEGDMLYIDFKNPAGVNAERIATDLDERRPTPVTRSKPFTTKESNLNNELVSHAEPAIRPYDSAKIYKGRKVTLEFADAEVRKIFQLLSEVSNKNFVLGDDVTGTISIKLVNVPWDQALDIILDTKGLDKREDGNIIIIKGKGKFKSQAEEDLELKKQQMRAIELRSETFNVNYSDINGIVSQFMALKSDRGVISPDVRTNKVIVRDIPQVLDDMRKLLQQIDIPEKQVMIEARIVEATSTFTHSLGVNWGIHYKDGSGSFLGISGLDTGFGGLTTAAPTSGTGTTSGGNLGISFGTLASAVQLDMRLSAAASAGLIKIVSTPKIATLNNKTAKITQGQQIPYTSSTSDKTETKFIEAALALEVTPHINANGTISMKIDAKNDSMGTVVTGATAPAINKKEATTEMLLRDGETTVIGGIFVDNDNESDEGVPWLMDIPILGKLVKTSTKTKTKSELLVFITPRIISSF